MKTHGIQMFRHDAQLRDGLQIQAVRDVQLIELLAEDLALLVC